MSVIDLYKYIRNMKQFEKHCSWRNSKILVYLASKNLENVQLGLCFGHPGPTTVRPYPKNFHKRSMIIFSLNGYKIYD